MQAEFYTNSIYEINRNGEASVYIDEGLNGPVGIAIDNQNNLYVCNCKSNSIIKITPQKVVTTIASGQLFACPNGITMDNNGNIYVVNFSNDDIILINKQQASKFATIEDGNGNAHIAFQQGKLYVTKIKTNKLYQVDLEGNITLIAGNGKVGLIDGLARDAELANPNGITAMGRNYLLMNNIKGIWGGFGDFELVIRRVKLQSN